MRINNSISIQNAYKNYSNNVKNVQKPAKAEKVDKLNISQSAKDYQIAMDAFKNLPEVRQQKVENIKNQINLGQYKPSTDEIVDKIMSNGK